MISWSEQAKTVVKKTKLQEIAEKRKTTVKVVDIESVDSWIALGDSLDLEAGWDDCVHWLQDCEHCSGDITSEHSEDWEEVVDVDREGCCSGVSEVSDRKREERRFYENEQSAAMWRASWQMQQLTSSGQESVICPSFSQWKQNISGNILAMTRPIALTAGWCLIFAPQAHEVSPKTQQKEGTGLHICIPKTSILFIRNYEQRVLSSNAYAVSPRRILRTTLAKKSKPVNAKTSESKRNRYLSSTQFHN